MPFSIILSSLSQFKLSLQELCFLHDALNLSELLNNPVLSAKIDRALHTLESQDNAQATLELTTPERGVITTLLSRLLNDDDYFPGMACYRNCSTLRDRLRS
jgi:hypothetical protein